MEMMMNREYLRKDQRELLQEEESAYTSLFTAGVILLMVGLKRALVGFLVEQWRAWVFLLLNLVLLAIFFTSTGGKSSQLMLTGKKNDAGIHQMKKKTHNLEEGDRPKIWQESKRKRRSSTEGEGEGEGEGDEKFSKEELNERAEAFIAMFRQHLASDARKGLLSRTKQEI